MAKSFCPEWVYNVAVSRTAYEFIIAEMPIRSYAKKYAIGLSEVFNEIKFEEIENEAELLLRFLVEMNTDNADELLNFYVYYTLKFENQGTPRKIKGIFGSALTGIKEKKYGEETTLKSFRAYVFGLRSGVSEKPSAGWDVNDETELEFLGELLKKEADIVDAL